MKGEKIESVCTKFKIITAQNVQNCEKKRGLDMAGDYYLTHEFSCNMPKAFEDNFTSYFL